VLLPASGALACLVTCLPAVRAEDRSPKPVPTYTNEDLRRVSPDRDQTGVASQPAFETPDPGESPPRGRRAPRGQGRGEDYWRREAERAADRVRPLERQVEALRRKVEARRRVPGVMPYSDPQIVEWKRQIAELNAEVRLLRDRVEDRARREGVLPGWLR